ncbi:uncharacterized protein N7459_000974 [Penicillium hispanicum]|uniref:uncharacterized protein n=1 Tax=Penicillium hispanicum TaxID=1080232 RepID=UPI0025407CCC|nr:uncharacterized protein N7459_000974 [Penicillium hispanicum]KAJ5594766.1 hypothetical protein N7459_000974 [Penicillium hispanicum]
MACDPNKQGLIHMGSVESEQKLGLLVEDDGFEPQNNAFIPRLLKRGRAKQQRSSPLWHKLKVATKLALAGLLIFSLAGLITGKATDAPSPHPETAPPLCQTPECVHAASEILYNLDPSYAKIDPCTDFDQFVCGGWRERHDMRSDQGSIFAGTLMDENAETRLRHILERSQSPNAADTGNFKKLKAAYSACLDESTARKRGSEPLIEVLAELRKIYPTKSGLVTGTQHHLTNAILFLIKSGVEALVAPSISPDDRDPDNVAIFVTPPEEIGLPTREYYKNTKTVAKYAVVLEQILRAFEVADPEKIAKQVVGFEAKLAEVTPDTETQEDVTQYYNPLSAKDTESLVPEISFSDILSELAPHDYQGDRLIVGSPSYMRALSDILNNASRETVSFFLQWKLIQHFSKIIEDDKVTPLRRFTNELTGKDPDATEERWRKCIHYLDEDLGWSLSRFYVLDAFSEESKQLGDQIVSDIKERFIFTLDQTHWMSPDVRKLGIQKVENIVQKIGFPTKSPNVLDARDVEEYYHGLEVSESAFFENELAVAKFNLHNEWSKLGKPTNRDEWDMTAPTVNAYYNPPGNEIVFPAGIMQPPTFYGNAAPLYLSYGAFGAVSGHELSHAFDSTGRHYDETGNYTNWWNPATVEAFEKRAQCFVDQYSKFTVEGPEDKILHVNGRLTLGENIADAGGLTAAFHAWKKHDETKSDPHLPGLENFTKEQLFFISYGNWWCGKSTREAAERAIYSDPHAPKAARNIETMANSREFKDAFNCPIKQPVCKLW